MKRIALLVLVCSVLTPFLAVADSGDDTLRLYLSKSDLVILGTIVSEPMGITDESGVPNYICEFKVSDVCKGNAELKDNTIKVNIKRFEMKDEDHHPLIKKDAECILFLKQEPKGNTPTWTTSDFWFGIQHPIPWMLNSLKRLTKQKD